MSESRPVRLATRFAILLSVLLILTLGPTLWSRIYRGKGEDGVFPQSLPGGVYFLAGNYRYFARDRDDDGRVDCLIRPGLSAILGRGTLTADGFTGRCSRWRGRPMPPELRELLTELLSSKVALRAGHTSGVDLDGDREVDCVLNAHNPEVVVLEAEVGRCPRPGGRLMTAEERQKFSEILAIEEAVRRVLVPGA